MSQIETVKIESDNKHGFITINKSDFDAKTHKLAGGDDGKKEPVKQETTAKKAQTTSRRRAK